MLFNLCNPFDVFVRVNVRVSVCCDDDLTLIFCVLFFLSSLVLVVMV